MPRGKGTGTHQATARSYSPVQRQATARANKLREELFSNDLTIPELAHVLNRSPAAVSGYLRNGTIQGYRVGRSWRITEDAVRDYAASLRGIAQKTSHAYPTWGTITHPATATIPYQVPVGSNVSAGVDNQSD